METIYSISQCQNQPPQISEWVKTSGPDLINYEVIWKTDNKKRNYWAGLNISLTLYNLHFAPTGQPIVKTMRYSLSFIPSAIPLLNSVKYVFTNIQTFVLLCSPLIPVFICILLLVVMYVRFLISCVLSCVVVFYCYSGRTNYPSGTNKGLEVSQIYFLY